MPNRLEPDYDKPTPAMVRELLEEGGMNVVTGTGWPLHPVVVAGHTYEYATNPGYLFVDDKPCYSAAWL